MPRTAESVKRSGGSSRMQSLARTIDADVALLEKPFSEAQLLDKVRAVLDSDG